MTTTLTLLGAFRLEHDGRLARLATRKVESLFAFLALHPEAHPREKLAALFWGDSTDEQARHSLRTALASIRKEIGEEILVADRETVQLNSDVEMWVDVREFEQNVESNSGDAHELYRGDLLPDFYDEWVLLERERLYTLYVRLLLGVAQQHRSRSEYGQAIQVAQKVLSLDRANEQAHQHLMFCYAAQGDRIAALKQYDECKKVLRDELNAEPSSETTALRDQIQSELTGAPAPSAELTNLPNPLTSFIGREKELKELGELLATSRLLTLMGAGGSGKTRLAIQAAHATLGDFKHGAWWVDLSDLRDEALVPQAMMQALGASQVPDQTHTETLTRYLKSKQVLLVIDNCEHLIEACAQLAETLLSAAPGLEILATSREALNIAGETVYQVPTLAMPSEVTGPVELMGYESVHLFVARAKAIKADFALTKQNANAVKSICQRLDGIPLALELAAARVKLLSVEHIAARLDDRFKLLRGGGRTALPRQQTLRATIDWSYDLLPEPAQKLFRRLSVFVSGFTLEAAEAVCSDEELAPEQVLDEVGRLVDRSLVLVESSGVETRYRMLETIREYAQEKLLELGELDAARDSHLRYFVEYGKRAGKKLELWDEQLAWFANVETEFENIRAAFKRGLESSLDLAIDLLWSIRVFWFNRRIVILPDWQIQALPQAEIWDSPKRARIIVGAGGLVIREQLERGSELMQRGLQVALDSGDAWEIAFACLLLGRRARTIGDMPAARTLLEKSVAHFREAGDEWFLCWALGELAWAVAPADRASARRLMEETYSIAQKLKERRLLSWVLNGLGDFERLEGNYPKAALYFEESMLMDQDVVVRTRYRKRPLPGPTHLANLAHTYLSAGDYARAKQLTLQSLESARGEDEFFLIFPLTVFPRLLLARQKYAGAARLLSAQDVLTDLVGARWNNNAADRAQYEQDVAEARAHLEAQVFDAAWAEGKNMTLNEAIEYALEQTT